MIALTGIDFDLLSRYGGKPVSFGKGDVIFREGDVVFAHPRKSS